MPWKHRVSLEKTPFRSRGLPTVNRGSRKMCYLGIFRAAHEQTFEQPYYLAL